MLVGETYTLINYVSFINYLCYGVTIIGLIVLRWKKPKVFRPIKVKNTGATQTTFYWCWLVLGGGGGSRKPMSTPLFTSQAALDGTPSGLLPL